MHKLPIAMAAAVFLSLGIKAQENEPVPKTADASAQSSRLGEKWRALVGEWSGEGKGEPGKGLGTCSFQFDLQQHVLIRRSHSEYPAGGERPKTVHDDLMTIYPGSKGEDARAIYFDNEGHVIEYSATWSAGGDVVTFVSKPATNAPQFELVYRKLSPDTLTVTFGMAPPGQSGKIRPYVCGELRRSSPTSAK